MIVLWCALTGAILGMLIGRAAGSQHSDGMGFIGMLLLGFQFTIVGALVGLIVHFVAKYW